MEDFARASEVAPGDAVGQLGRALTLLNAGGTEESIALLRKEVARDASALNLRYLLVQALLRNGGNAYMGEAQQQLLEYRGRSDQHFAPARALLGKLYLQQRKHEAAIRELESALGMLRMARRQFPSAAL